MGTADGVDCVVSYWLQDDEIRLGCQFRCLAWYFRSGVVESIRRTICQKHQTRKNRRGAAFLCVKVTVSVTGVCAADDWQIFGDAVEIMATKGSGSLSVTGGSR